MNSITPTVDFTMERAGATLPVHVTLAAAPYNWLFDGPSPGSLEGLIDGVDLQEEVLAEAEAEVTGAAAAWDAALASLVETAALGTRLAGSKFKTTPTKLAYFRGLQYRSTGRDARYKQALAFEKAWKLSDNGWTFQGALTRDQFTTLRKAIKDLEDDHEEKVMAERHERALLHSLAQNLNEVCVRWYNDATATFTEDSVPGQLIRAVPTTYDPNRVPAQLKFTAHLSPAPNHGHLVWHAARGQKYYILAQGPEGSEFELMLNGVSDTEWMGLGLTPGLWQFKGYATNQHGEGAMSEVVQFTVAAAAVA